MTLAYAKIKLLHIITRFDKGGSAENTFLTAQNLDKDRYDVMLVAGSSPPANSPVHSRDPETAAIEANIADLHTKGVRLVLLAELVRDLSPLSDLSAFLSLVRMIRHEKPQIVHTHTSKAGFLGRWAAWLCRVPIIVHTPHGHVFWGYFGPYRTRLFIALERWSARITTNLVMLTEREKADHLRLRIAPDEKFAVIHSGIDLSRFRPDPARKAEIRSALEIPSESIVVATVGRLTAVKGQDTLIRAIAECLRQGEKVFLLILGEGELRSDLEALSAELGISEAVRFLGWRSDVASVIDACDIFCLPSLNEGMGKAIVEAMAMGKPVIASDVGGIPDLVIPGENGILVPPGDSNALAKAILNLRDHPEMSVKMGKQGRGKALRYGVESMLNKIDGLYSGLLAKSAHH
ncbi:MAG: glycosyltransferase family 4 protein [Syntrophales bacterium]|nr:glycosyltransferase family 4 protein [Syntrophales bacterium]